MAYKLQRLQCAFLLSHLHVLHSDLHTTHAYGTGSDLVEDA